MRILCLLLPRLGIQVARRRDPALVGHPVVVLAGDGETTLAAAASAEASACGVSAGTLASVARSRCPGAAFLPDNAGECLDVLEQAASILRLRATPNVAIGGRDHILVDLQGVEAMFADEATAASRLAGIAGNWIGYDIRAGVGSTREAAYSAARSARRFPVITGDSGEVQAADTPVGGAAERISGSFRAGGPMDPVMARARVLRILGGLQTVLDARGESFREVSLELTHISGAGATVRFRSSNPLHRAAEAIHVIGDGLPDGVLDGVTAVRVSLERLGPDVRVEPIRRESRSGSVVQAPVRPVQQRLLRAG